MLACQATFSWIDATYTKYLLPYEIAVARPGNSGEARRDLVKNRVDNEAAALRLLAKTNIPASEVLATGEDLERG